MMNYTYYTKVKPNSECHQEFLEHLTEEKRIKEKVKEFSKLHDLEIFHPTIEGRTFLLRGDERLLNQRFGDQIVNHYAYVFFKFKKDSEIRKVWDEYRQKHRLNMPSTRRFFRRFCITNDFRGCFMQYFIKDDELFFLFNSDNELTFNQKFIDEISQTSFEQAAKSLTNKPLTIL